MNTVCPGPVATDLWLGAHGVAATVSKASGANAPGVAAGAAAPSAVRFPPVAWYALFTWAD